MYIFLPIIDLIYLMLSLHNFVPTWSLRKDLVLSLQLQLLCSPLNRRDAAYAHSDITVLDNIFIFEVSHPSLVRNFSRNLLRVKRIPLSWAVSTMSTGSASTIWPGTPLTHSPAAWSSRSVAAFLQIVKNKHFFPRRRVTLGSLWSWCCLDWSTPGLGTSRSTSSGTPAWLLGWGMRWRWKWCWAGNHSKNSNSGQN